MALKYTAILLLVILVTLKFGGRDTEQSPFAELPGTAPVDVILSVAPLDSPQPAAQTPDTTPAAATTTAPVSVFAPAPVSAPPTPEPDPASVADLPEIDPQTALDLVLIDPAQPASPLDTVSPSPPRAEPDAPARQPEAQNWAEVTGTLVNLRAGPSTGNAVLGQARSGDRVKWLSDPAPGWALIQHPDLDGDLYMSSNFLRRIAN